jgi:alpha/beta superfamily hydrolase
MQQEKVFFNSGNLILEGRLAMPSHTGADPGVVLCHPHPLYGGSMNNNVIYTVSRALVEKGFAALRFNFRGVGRSEGPHDEGRGERDDALAAVSFLAGREGVDRSRLGLMGYSFGGAVALAAGMREETVKAVAAVSPVEIPALNSAKPRLVVCGGRDTMTPASEVLAAKERITAGGAGLVEVIAGADHFWMGFEEELAGLVAFFFARHLI